jgi:hypothetical protein
MEGAVEWFNLITGFNQLKRTTFHGVFRQVERTSFAKELQWISFNLSETDVGS